MKPVISGKQTLKKNFEQNNKFAFQVTRVVLVVKSHTFILLFAFFTESFYHIERTFLSPLMNCHLVQPSFKALSHDPGIKDAFILI